MVEAIIYFPLVVATVFFLIYVGLFKLQESAFIYAVERVAQYGANEVAYPGYQVFSNSISRKINFDWSSEKPLDDVSQVKQYYDRSHQNPLWLYFEIFGSGWITADQIQGQFREVSSHASILSVATGATYSVEIKRGVFGTDVIVGVKYKFNTPGIMRYLGLPPSYSYDRVALSRAVNPAGFVRNVDLSIDVLKVIAEKLNIEWRETYTKINDFLDKYF